ncbi:NAD-dependent epimerase/dehydratase family protein [Roseibium aggregatum]|uniref:NAD(P)-dependent oxidoreductase n=1 Tax=Roseibium aggregatum TaxID=187304 RepID=A0A939EG41_9HYPH|nr:NAD(P)-dependent oxidoreductase [Roseibium aggregatum]MBN9670914.1 NAD(P)-dependent oxidoreductase [Roseibium aggregatum]
MHVLVTGASGTVGRFIVKGLLDQGHAVTALGRRPLQGWPTAFHPFDLGDDVPVVPQSDALVHCALLHEPGRFRGGEGDDPERFRRLNADGTRRLFEAARNAGCRDAVFLSSRSVYGDHRKGETLLETDRPEPDTLYGRVKLAGEEALKGLSGAEFKGTVLRATGIYGCPPGETAHKWSELLKDFDRGGDISPRVGTEVHGDDLSAAVSLVLNTPHDKRPAFNVFNVSDLLLDRRDLLTLYGELAGISRPLPERSGGAPGVMDTGRLRELGWTPGGIEKLRSFLTCLVKGHS